TGGQALFISKTITNDLPDPSSTDFRALFQFADTYGGVTITNKSARDLYIHNISLAGGANPFVDLQGDSVDLTFDLRRTVSPTQVTIENLNPLVAADIILNGTIENPIGQTLIHATLGDIVAGTNRDEPVIGLGGISRTTLIRTRDLTLNAPFGTIGYDTQNPGTKNHLAVDIVQGALLAFDSPHQLESGDLVTYHASPASAALGGLIDGHTYSVIRLDDLRIRLAETATPDVAIAIDPANLEMGTHT